MKVSPLLPGQFTVAAAATTHRTHTHDIVEALDVKHADIKTVVVMGVWGCMVLRATIYGCVGYDGLRRFRYFDWFAELAVLPARLPDPVASADCVGLPDEVERRKR